MSKEILNNEYYVAKHKIFGKKYTLVVRISDNYVNISQLCISTGKQLKKWNENIKSKEQIACAMERLNMTNVSELMDEVRKYGSNPIIRGCYAHSIMATVIAHWISPSFAIDVSIWIEEWKKYSIDNQTRYLHSLQNLVPYTPDDKEKQIQKVLHKKYGGEIEVKIDSGKIDLLTEKYIIEIKTYINWKDAIGQILSYSIEFPKKKKVIYLFDVPEENILKTIRTVCNKYDIKLVIL